MKTVRRAATVTVASALLMLGGVAAAAPSPADPHTLPAPVSTAADSGAGDHTGFPGFLLAAAGGLLAFLPGVG
ncbi:hypothetical protein ACFP1Z_22180 [Streptomyces gamaensis]|uniref:Uncharacterized protein n=1 Tax=Streptomyces gamaensis TaxID=1763542 RepID=A0ABW0Z4K3_9ACTN